MMSDLYRENPLLETGWRETESWDKCREIIKHAFLEKISDSNIDEYCDLLKNNPKEFIPIGFYSFKYIPK